MLELQGIGADIIACYGKPAALDQIASSAETCVRVAPDELLLLFDSRGLAAREAELRALDPGSLAIDFSCGYALWELRGDDRLEAFCRLSAIDLPEPPGTAQGLVAHVPAKIVVRPDSLLVMVSPVVSHHLRKRVLAACADLQPVESPVPQVEDARLTTQVSAS